MRQLDRARNEGLVSSVAILADVLEPTYIDLAKRCTVAEATTPGTRSGARAETPCRAPRAGCSDAAVGESCQEPIVTPTSKSAGECVAEARGGTPLPIGARLGDFEVTGVIHEDESSVIYVAADRSSMGKVAIKEYLPARLAERMANGNVGVRSLRHKQAFRDGMQRFLSEARMLAALDEPALIEVLRSWEQNGTAYMAMPLYEGRTLKDVLRDSPRPREAWLKTMFGPLLDALATLHRSGRCPCDVTPDNIVVLTDGAPLFIGFGAAPRIVASTTDDVTGVLNSGFAAIERYAYDPSMPEGPWTDIYSVAAVLHLAITGKPPPAPTTRMVADTMPPMSDVTSDYSKLFLDALDRGLAVRPTNRPQTIAEFRAALGIPSIASGAIPMQHPTSVVPGTGTKVATLIVATYDWASLGRVAIDARHVVDRRRAGRTRASCLDSGRASTGGSGDRGSCLVDEARSGERTSELACCDLGTTDPDCHAADGSRRGCAQTGGLHPVSRTESPEPPEFAEADDDRRPENRQDPVLD